MVQDSSQQFEFIWRPWEDMLGTTLSSVAYETDQGNVTFSGNSVSGSVATIRMTPTQAGDKLIKMTATMADSSTVVRYVLLNVADPELWSSGGYYPYQYGLR